MYQVYISNGNKDELRSGKLENPSFHYSFSLTRGY